MDGDKSIEDEDRITVTVRMIRSFEHRNVRRVVYKKVDRNQTIGEFKEKILMHMQSRSDIPPPVKNYPYDTFKIEHKAHGAKSNDLVINTEDGKELFLDEEKTLHESGVANETELSFFNMQDYVKYLANPTWTW